MRELMQLCDVLITTEEDIERVFGIKGKDYEDAAALTAKRFPLKTVAITLRENPLVWKNTWTAIALPGRQGAADADATRWRSSIASAPATRSRPG